MNSSPYPPQALSRRAALFARAITFPIIKPVAISIGMSFFFVGYFLLLKWAVFFPVTEMPVTGLDRLIGFHPSALLLYVSLWFYVPLVPTLFDDGSEFLAHGMAAAVICSVGFAIFFFFPTVTPQPDIDWASYPMFESLKTIDRSGNACPSLHAGFAIFSGLCLDRILRQIGFGYFIRGMNAVWCLGILYSTMATKQHVAVDVMAGLMLGVIGVRLQPFFLLLTRKLAVAESIG